MLLHWDMTRTLRDYLRQKRASMRASALHRPRGEDWREAVSATCIADDETGVRKMRMRDWQFIGDSGPVFGGWGLGPSSPELLCGVISTCLTHTYLIGAAWLDIPIDRVEVRVTAENNDAGFLDIESGDPDLPFAITAHVDLVAEAATAAQVARLHAYASERCPITRLVRGANELTIVVA